MNRPLLLIPGGIAAAFFFAHASAHASPPVFTPEAYGASCSSSDNSAAFAALAAAVNAAQTGIIDFASNCTYLVFPSPTSAQSVLMNLSGLNNLTINFNGTTIATNYSFSSAYYVYGIIISNSKNVVVNSPSFDQPNYRVRDHTRGMAGVAVGQGTTNVIVNNFNMRAGAYGFSCARSANEPKASRVTITNGVFTDTFYPLSFQANCDDVTATGIETIHPGRSYFVWNVSNHNVQLVSDASDEFNDIIIGHNYWAADTTQDAYKTSNIRVNYTNRPKSAVGAGVASFATIQFSSLQSAQSYQQINDIYLNLDVARSDARGGTLLQISSAHPTSRTAQGRRLENVYVTGNAILNSSVSPFMELMSREDWTGDYVRNLQISNMTCTYGGTAALRVDGNAIRGPFIMNGVWGTSACTFAPTNMGSSTAAFPFLSYNQVWLPGAITP